MYKTIRNISTICKQGEEMSLSIDIYFEAVQKAKKEFQQFLDKTSSTIIDLSEDGLEKMDEIKSDFFVVCRKLTIAEEYYEAVKDVLSKGVSSGGRLPMDAYRSLSYADRKAFDKGGGKHFASI
jgi:hypothetical protein